MPNNRIRELRLEKRITQLQLSIELNVTQETISAYEHGRHLPSLEALMKMSLYFNASMDYIMGMSDIRNVQMDFHLTPEEQAQRERLLHYYNILSTKNKSNLISYAEGLYDSYKN